MDSTGCQVAGASGEDDVGQLNNGSYSVTFEKCAKDFDNAIDCAPLYPNLYPTRSKDKFCQLNHSEDYVSSYWTKIKELNHCFTDIPNFLYRYNAINRNPASTKNSKKDTPKK